MKTKIEVDSLLYKRRLVRELNGRPDGFYVHLAGGGVIRSSLARIRNGILQFHQSGHGWCNIFDNALTLRTIIVADPYGHEITASRQPR